MRSSLKAAVTDGGTFEGGYAARWIHSDRERPVTLQLSTSGLDEEKFPCKPEARARESVLRTQQNGNNPVINE